MGVRTPQELKRLYQRPPHSIHTRSLIIKWHHAVETSFASVLTTKSMGATRLASGLCPTTAFAIYGVWRSQRSPELLRFQTIGKLKTPQAAEIPQTGFAALASTLLRVWARLAGGVIEANISSPSRRQVSRILDF
jgi:hypothetical protein